MRNYWLWTAVLIAAVLALVSMLSRGSPNVLEDNFSLARVIYLLMVLAFIGSGFFATQQMRLAAAIKQAVAWFAIFAILVVGYTYRDDFNTIFERVSGEVAPARAVSTADGNIVLHRRDNGHFAVNANVNSSRVQFLVDTGASDVALTYRDAERAGLEPWNLQFNTPYRTANGTAYGARVQIQSITVGDIKIYNVEGSVMKDGMDVSLLGMSFLDRLSSYEVRGNKMTMRR